MDVGSDTRSAHVHGDVMEKEKPLDDDETTDEMRDVRRRLLVNKSLILMFMMISMFLGREKFYGVYSSIP